MVYFELSSAGSINDQYFAVGTWICLTGNDSSGNPPQQPVPFEGPTTTNDANDNTSTSNSPNSVETPPPDIGTNGTPFRRQRKPSKSSHRHFGSNIAHSVNGMVSWLVLHQQQTPGASVLTVNGLNHQCNQHHHSIVLQRTTLLLVSKQ